MSSVQGTFPESTNRWAAGLHASSEPVAVVVDHESIPSLSATCRRLTVARLQPPAGMDTGTFCPMHLSNRSSSGSGIAPGEGKTVNLFLPFADRQHQVPESTPTPETSVAASGIRILVVEDDERLRRLSRRFLEGRGWTVLEAEDADSALRLLDQAENDPDVVITDVVLPDWSGPELIAEARTRHPEILVLYVSGYAPSDADAGRTSRPDVAWLQNPYSFEILIHEVEALLARRSDLRRQAASSGGTAGTS